MAGGNGILGLSIIGKLRWIRQYASGAWVRFEPVNL